MRAELANFFSQRHSAIKAAHPDEGRRRWALRVMEQFWASNHSAPNAQNLADVEIPDEDEDPFDAVTYNVVGGIVLRTDYSDEDAWTSFHDVLKEAQKEYEPQASSSSAPEAPSSSKNEDAEEEENDEDEDDEDGLLIKVVNPEIQEERALFDGISNIAALRLFTDIDIRPSPIVPHGTKRIDPQHRLIDHNGWQEVYQGIHLWIYDKQSNTDKCVRSVSLEGDFYGTATGDSWRTQATHIYDLQANMLSGMTINFGGMDRWDYNERKRNLDEALLPIT